MLFLSLQLRIEKQNYLTKRRNHGSSFASLWKLCIFGKKVTVESILILSHLWPFQNGKKNYKWSKIASILSLVFYNSRLKDSQLFFSGVQLQQFGLFVTSCPPQQNLASLKKVFFCGNETFHICQLFYQVLLLPLSLPLSLSLSHPLSLLTIPLSLSQSFYHSHSLIVSVPLSISLFTLWFCLSLYLPH